MKAEIATDGNRSHMRCGETRGLAAQPREREVPQLSGFQTVPVNQSMNDEHKRVFFSTLSEITGGGT